MDTKELYVYNGHTKYKKLFYTIFVWMPCKVITLMQVTSWPSFAWGDWILVYIKRVMSHNVKLLAEITKKCNSYSMILFLISSVLTGFLSAVGEQVDIIWYGTALHLTLFRQGEGGKFAPQYFNIQNRLSYRYFQSKTNFLKISKNFFTFIFQT